MRLISTFTLLTLFGSLLATAQNNHSKDHFVSDRPETTHAPRHRVQPSTTIAAKSTATASRLVGSASFQYDTDSVYFILEDTSHVTYSGQRGGDLNSEFIKFDHGMTLVNNGGTLENDIIFDQTFDGNDNILTRISQQWNGSAFVNDYGTVYTYDGNNNILTETEIEWNTGTSTWDSSYRYAYTYDMNSHMLTETGAGWNGSVWVYNYGYNYTLDLNGNVVISTYSNWNTGSSTWDSVGKFINTYNGNNLITLQTQQNWVTNAWNDNTQYVTTYDLNNNLLTSTRNSWNGTVWVIAQVATNTYTNNDLVNSLSQNGMGMNQTNQDNIFDGNHNMLSSISQFWIGTAFVNNSRDEYTYNSYDQAVTMKESTWDGSSWLNDDTYLERYYYQNYTTSVNDTKLAQSDITLYPVPARNFITVQKNWSETQPFTISITDMQGRMVRHYSEMATTNYSRTIDVNQLPAGNYVIKVAGTNSKASYQQFSVIH